MTPAVYVDGKPQTTVELLRHTNKLKKEAVQPVPVQAFLSGSDERHAPLVGFKIPAGWEVVGRWNVFRPGKTKMLKKNWLGFFRNKTVKIPQPCDAVLVEQFQSELLTLANFREREYNDTLGVVFTNVAPVQHVVQVALLRLQDAHEAVKAVDVAEKAKAEKDKPPQKQKRQPRYDEEGTSGDYDGEAELVDDADPANSIESPN